MKKTMRMATMLVAGAMMLAACNNGGFKDAGNGLSYKFEKQNKSAQQVQDGDVLVGEMTVKFDTTQTFSNVGHADRILQADPAFFLYDALVLMHVGDKAVLAYEADSLAKFLQPNQMPPYYEKGKGMKIYYEISLQDIVTKEELEEEQNNYIAEMKARQENEPEAIAAYVSENNITVKPNDKGVYVVIKKKGTGAKVAAGRTVAMNYTGRLLDGTMFDSSVESDAIQGGLQQPGRVYEPLTYVVGKMSLIPGWEESVMGQPAGTIMQVVMPSAQAYGPQGTRDGSIPPFSPLVFDIEIVSVK